MPAILDEPVTTPTNEDHVSDVRLPAAQLDQLRAVATRRYLARLTTWGESVHPEERQVLGLEAPVIAVTGPWLGAEMAASAVGVPVNLGRRPDGVLTHWTPVAPGRFLHGLHPETFVGFIGACWPDRHGLMGEVLILRDEITPDLDQAEAEGELWSAGLCLLFTVVACYVSKVRFSGHHVLTVRRARAFALDFAGLPLSAGSRLLRRLAPDEALPEGEGPAPDARLILAPPLDTGERHDEGAADLAPGSVGTGQLQNQAVTTPKRQPLVTLTVPFSISAGVGVFTNVEVTHGLGVIPNATVDSQTGGVLATLTNLDATRCNIILVNVTAEGRSGTAKVYVW